MTNEMKMNAWELLFQKFGERTYTPNRTLDQRLADLREFLQEDYFLTVSEKRDPQYSQRKHARSRHIDPGTFNQWFNGQRLPDGDNLFQLALVYGPLIYDIVGVPSGGFDPRERLVIENFRSSDEEGKREALRRLQEIKNRRPANNIDPIMNES